MKSLEEAAQGYLAEAVTEVKIAGRQAVPRDELYKLALSKAPHMRGKPMRKMPEHIERQIEVGISNGLLKLAECGKKLWVCKKREMKTATAENGFARAADLPSGVLAHVCSFSSNQHTLAAWDASSRLLSDQLPWRTLALSHFPSLRLLDAAEDVVGHRAWREIYWRNMRMIRRRSGRPRERAPLLSEYVFTFEIWKSDPRESLEGNLIECGTWSPESGGGINAYYSDMNEIIYNGAYLLVSLDSLSTLAIASLRDGRSWFRSVVAKRGSMETFLLYDGVFFLNARGVHELEESSSIDLIAGSSRYVHIHWNRRAPVIASVGLEDFEKDPGAGPSLSLELLWRDNADGEMPMELSHFEQFLAYRADWS